MLRKNDILPLEITGLTSEGNGVGRAEGVAVFVPFTAPGDVIECRIVKVKKSYCYGIVERLITPSLQRCESGCEVYGRCGGCCFRHISYECELKQKENFVKDSFRRIGGLQPNFEPILGSSESERYRNKAQFPVSEAGGRLICGFYARRSHRTAELSDCLLQPQIFSQIARFTLSLCEQAGIIAYDEQSGSGVLRHIYLRRGEHSGEIMLCLVVTDGKAADFFELGRQAAEKFPEIKSVMININRRSTNVILGDSWFKAWGREYIRDVMCGRELHISAAAFYQVNTLQAERLYGIAKEYAALKKGERLLDLYCGIGTIGICVADSDCELTGVEVIPQAVENAKANARQNGFYKAQYHCGDAGKIAELISKSGERPDVIIADPARKGCDRLSLDSMIKMSPRRIVMISCDPATAARDCAYLCENGYEVKRARAVDMFPRTGHVECVVLMTRIGE